MIHDLLRDIGRKIVQEISSKNCGEHSRLWNPDDVIGVVLRAFEVEAFAKMQELRLLQLQISLKHREAATDKLQKLDLGSQKAVTIRYEQLHCA